VHCFRISCQAKALAPRRRPSGHVRKGQGTGAQQLREYLTDIKVRFDEQWRRSFSFEDFPENAKRFDIKLEDWLPKRRP